MYEKENGVEGRRGAFLICKEGAPTKKELKRRAEEEGARRTGSSKKKKKKTPLPDWTE